MTILPLAVRSLLNRRTTVGLTVFAIAISVALLLGVQKLRTEAREGFARTIAGADLIVGARTSPVNLLLYAVFRIGDPTNSISWDVYQEIAGDPAVAWTIPISLGDAHRGYRVLGTTPDYFEHYRYARDRALSFDAGGPFDGVFDAVLGADVARELGHALDERIVLAHGIGATSFAEHRDRPFTVVGVLAPTGTPVDRAVHVSLAGIEAMHEDWQDGHFAKSGNGADIDDADGARPRPEVITAFLLGLESKVNTFAVQRAINEYQGEPLMAIMPAVTLRQLWSLVGVAETALTMVAALVVIAGLLGMLTAILTGLNERRREMAILRALGARASQIFALLIGEAGLVVLAGILIGTGGCYAMLAAASPLLRARLGISIELTAPGLSELALLGVVLVGGLLAGAWPAWRAYRNALHDGLSLRL